MDYSLFDRFGTGIGLRYLNKERFQTHFGAFVTALICILIGIQAVLIGKEMIYKENPDVIFSERFIGSPARFDVKKETFNLAIGPQYPGNFSHFVDDSVYTVVAEQVLMRKVLNETTQIYEQKWTKSPLKIQPCTKDDFQVVETQSYFNTLPRVDQMNCIKDDDAFIEGNFDQDIFSYIRIAFKLCQNDVKCRPPKEINDILVNSFIALYTNDVIVDPKNYNPFNVVGRDFFWNASPYFTKDIQFYIRNIYAESDEGLFFEKKSLTKASSYSFYDEQIIFGENDYYFSIVLRFEKYKESMYYRKYKKLGGLLAEIGGIAKALMMIGFFVCIPINRLIFQEQISNSLFSFKRNTHIDDQKLDGQRLVNLIESKQKHIQEYKDLLLGEGYIREPKINQSYEFKEGSPQQKANLNLVNPCSEHSIMVSGTKFTKQTMGIELCPQIPKEEIVVKQKQDTVSLPPSFNKLVCPQNLTQSGIHLMKLLKKSKKINKVIESEQEISLVNHKDQILSLQSNNHEMNNISLKNFGVEKKEEHPNLKKSVGKVDINNTLRKNGLTLNKLEKNLERNERNNDKLDFKWSDYIKYYLWPFGEFNKRKKQVQYSMEKIYEHLDMMYIVKKLLEFEKLKQLILDDNQRKLIQFLPRPTIDVDEIDKQKDANQSTNESQKLNLLTDVNNLNDSEKATQAFQALRTILQKEQLSDIDKNIIKMLDVNVLQNIENNTQILQQIDYIDENNQYKDIYQVSLQTQIRKNSNNILQNPLQKDQHEHEIILNFNESSSNEDKEIIDENDLQDAFNMNKNMSITSEIPKFSIQSKIHEQSKRNTIEQPHLISNQMQNTL